MTVHFIGAGPGAPVLITVRGRDLVARCPVCLYAGSLVPKEILDLCPPGARLLNTAALAGAGPGAVLILPRIARDNATCAIARAPLMKETAS